VEKGKVNWVLKFMFSVGILRYAPSIIFFLPGILLPNLSIPESS
jgi:hypothetical protein